MNQFPYLYPHSLSEAERLNEEELWQDNRDAEVSHTQLTEMFRHSDPAALMDEAEQAQLAELDDTVTVYRGVTTINSDNLLALSWTLDYETADWFARRFDEDGTVYKAQIDKEHKQSKKQRKEYNAKQRGSWNGISPVTRIVPNGKAYDRNRIKREDHQFAE